MKTTNAITGFKRIILRGAFAYKRNFWQPRAAPPSMIASPMMFRRCLLAEAVQIIKSNDINAKIQRTLQATNQILHQNALIQSETHDFDFVQDLPDFPGRPDLPVRVDDPALIPKPQMMNPPMSFPVYILHSIAHIELNAVELYWDTMVRFDSRYKEDLPTEFFEEIASVLNDEASHFELCRTRLEELGSFYGACPVHNRQWEHANVPELKQDVKARLVILSLVQEARGLDASPRFIKRLRSLKDHKSADIVEKICSDEVKHVGFGMRWFEWICNSQDLKPVPEFHRIVKKFLPEGLVPPLNESQRIAAGMSEDYFKPLVKLRSV
jgi:uncharacterized ferritin-like protein (DUF455 family)